MTARWFADATGEAFAAARVTLVDVRDYRAHLRTVTRRAPPHTLAVRGDWRHIA